MLAQPQLSPPTTTLKTGIATTLYLIVSGAMFLLVAVFHLFRLLYQWQIIVGNTNIPYVLSYVGLPASTAYFVWACWLLRRRRPRAASASA